MKIVKKTDRKDLSRKWKTKWSWSLIKIDIDVMSESNHTENKIEENVVSEICLAMNINKD